MNVSAPSLPKNSSSMPSLRQVLALAIPQTGLMLCLMSIALIDLWVAGRIDTAVLASLGIVTQIFTLLVLVTAIVGSGCLAAMTQALGAGLAARAQRYAGLILLLSAGAGAIVGLAGMFLLPVILYLLQVPDELAPVINTFVRIYCLNLPFHYTLMLLNSVFRAYRLMYVPFFSLVVVLLGNLCGSLGFGLGWWGFPNYGYTGVAWSTFGATLMGLACSLLAVRRYRLITRASFAPWKWNRRALPYILRVGAPSALGQLLEKGSSLVLLALVGTLPGAVDIIAGMTVGMRIQYMVLFPLGAISMTMTIFSGHLLGANQGDVLVRLGARTALWSTAFFAIVGVTLFFTREPVAAFMAPRPEVVRHAAWFLAFGCISIPLTACTMSLYGVFAGAGATLYTFLMSCLSMWVVQIPLAWFLAHKMGWGETGIFIAITSSEFAYMVAILLVFRSRKWLAFGMKQRKNNGSSG